MREEERERIREQGNRVAHQQLQADLLLERVEVELFLAAASAAAAAAFAAVHVLHLQAELQVLHDLLALSWRAGALALAALLSSWPG